MMLRSTTRVMGHWIAAIGLMLPALGWQERPEPPSNRSPFDLDLPAIGFGGPPRVVEEERPSPFDLDLPAVWPDSIRGDGPQPGAAPGASRITVDAGNGVRITIETPAAPPSGTAAPEGSAAAPGPFNDLSPEPEGVASEAREPDGFFLPADVAAEFFAEERLKPKGPPPIPDDPPPNEGALIDYPHLFAPPDLVRIEVLEALPGRPITGERLVRPDGTMGLDFYGDIYVRGMTRDEIKVHAIRLLRGYLHDAALGLIELDPDTLDDVHVPPAESSRVFVDVAAYNSKVYYISGDVVQAGRPICTGADTVLDALNYCGGLLPTADPTDIRLVRPSRGDRPARVYEIDLEAIIEGDATANLQIFPGDRLVVGRDASVETSVASNRLAEPLAALGNIVQNYEVTLDRLEGRGREYSPERQAELLQAWADLWAALTASGGADPGATRRLLEDLIRLLHPPAPPAEGEPDGEGP